MISEYMTADHRHCDELFADIEAILVSGEQVGATEKFNSFLSEMEHHFSMEEDILFPAFERVTGMSNGPTAMMRHEHTQMRNMFQQMSESMDAGDVFNYLGIAETLLVMMQQHNMKEEQVLYPMVDNTLSDQREDIIDQLREMPA